MDVGSANGAMATELMTDEVTAERLCAFGRRVAQAKGRDVAPETVEAMLAAGGTRAEQPDAFID